ncbi:MFS transporter [Hydrogenophaga sp. 5NK40-0174]|uniref:MFS transporter n=1 Tax=Hydrogenophaga sp. 5NK40-0174 TaxID=3127649 RepID=UPI003107A8A8
MNVVLPIGIALVMVGTHGYGLFLFGAILPDLQRLYNFDYSFAGAASATLNTAYMVGALSLSAFGRRLPAERWFLISVAVCIVLLALIPLVPNMYWMIATFIPLGMAAAVSWSSTVGVVNGIPGLNNRSLILTIGAGGGSLGMLTIGLMTGYGKDLLSSHKLWYLGAAATFLGLALIYPHISLHKKAPPSSSTWGNVEESPWTAKNVQVGVLAVLLSGLLGATAVPFTTYLSAYLTTEVGQPESVASSVWQVLGVTGALAGMVIGSLADRFDHRKILAVLFLGFSAAAALLAVDPTSQLVPLVGIGHGITQNPFWGLVAAYLGCFFSASATMRIDALGLAAFGLVGGMANWSIGFWVDSGGSLESVYAALAVGALVMVALTALAPPSSLKKDETLNEQAV